MTANASEPLKELEDQKALLTTQIEILELKSKVAELTKAVEAPPTPVVDKAAEPAADTPAPAANGDKEGGEGEGGSEASPTETAGYLAEITAYEVLKATAIAVGTGLSLAGEDRVLVLGDQCLVEPCLPLSDLALRQTEKQIDVVREKVDVQTGVIEGLLERRRDETEVLKKADDTPALYSDVTTWLTGWGGAVDAASKLVAGVVALIGQFTTSYTFQERDVTLPVEALVTATAGAIPGDRAHLFALGKISVADGDGSVLDKLTGLIKAVQRLDELRIRLMALVVAPLTAETIRLTNSIARQETTKATLATAIAATEKRIGELEIQKKHETDASKKALIQDKIDLEGKGLGDLNAELTEVKAGIAREQKALAAINIKLARASAEADVAANLAKTFIAFFEGITAVPDKTKLSTLANAVLREYILTFSHLLRLSIHSGGAEMVKRKFLWWESRTFVGGCAISYALATATDGKVVQAGLEVAAAQRDFSFKEPAETRMEAIPPAGSGPRPGAKTKPAAATPTAPAPASSPSPGSSPP